MLRAGGALSKGRKFDLDLLVTVRPGGGRVTMRCLLVPKSLLKPAICRTIPLNLGGSTAMTSAATARLEARISTDLHAMLKRASELQGRTMTDFVVAAVQDAAQNAITQAEVIRLSLADQECFAQAMLSPPKATPALKRAFTRHRKLLRAE
jgi:uncharacterized protein (DUF1778 family)